MSNNYQPLRPTKVRQKVSSAARPTGRATSGGGLGLRDHLQKVLHLLQLHVHVLQSQVKMGKIGRRNVTCKTCLWHVWCFWHVLKCRFLVLALLSYPKIVEEFCRFRWQHKASRCPFLVVDHPCIQATLRLWSVSSVLWDGTPCMWSTARGEVRINHPKLC